MSRNIWKGFKLLLIALIILNVIWTILLFRYSTNKHNIFKNSPTRITTTDQIGIKGITIGDPIDIRDLPHNINSWNLTTEDWRWFFTDKSINQPLVYKNRDVSFAQLSPSHKKLGFYFYLENHSLGEIVLAVLDLDEKVVKEVYRGDNWTSNWEWKGDAEIIVKRSCGTGCMNAYVINIMTGEKVDSYRVY